MNDQEDPALKFFPSGNVDLYAALEVSKEASQDEIKKAYKKLALRYHPDKVLSGHLTSSTTTSSSSATLEDAQAAAAERFQQIGFAYAVLSDEARRKRFDDTGRTDESAFEGVDWEAYFKDLWQGEVTAEAIEDFKKKYRDSSEERSDILDAYRTCNGQLADILNSVPCLEVLEDEERVISLVEAAIKAKEIKRLAGWTKSTSDDKARRSMRATARKEAAEAEEYAKELGVWDELFGSKKGAKGKATKRKAGDGEAEGDGQGHEDDEEEEDAKPKKGKGKAAAASSSKRSKKTAAEENEEDDVGGLAALIAARQAKRNSGLDDMIARLEAEAAAKKGGKKGKAKRSRD